MIPASGKLVPKALCNTFKRIIWSDSESSLKKLKTTKKHTSIKNSMASEFPLISAINSKKSLFPGMSIN